MERALQRETRPPGPAPVLRGRRAPHRAVRPPPPPQAARLPAAQQRAGGADRGHAAARRPRRRRDRAPRAAGHRARHRRRDRRHRAGGGRRRAADTLAVGPYRRGTHPRSAHGRLRPRPAHARRVLHPHPHRSPRQPAQQRCDRRPAGVQQHPLGSLQQPGHAAAHARGDAQPLLADHPRHARPAAAVRPAGPADGHPAGAAGARTGQPQRRDEHPDDRAVLRARRHPRQALRAARGGVRRVRRARAGCGTSAYAPPWCRRCSSPR